MEYLFKLYDDYRQHRKIDLTFEQFMPLVKYYPTLLVVHTDGRVDAREWRHLENMAFQLSDILRNTCADAEEVNDLRKIYVAEFRYLLQHFDTWERRFIKVLRQYLREHGNEKSDVMQSMVFSAAVSEGICDKEHIMIDHLKKELGID